MKDTKFPAKRIILLAALVVLILLLIICITMCGKQAEEMPAPETIAETSTPPTVQAVAEEPTLPEEETTEQTEQTTAPTEETVPPTTVPVDDTEFDPEEEAVVEDIEVPDPGTPENPYLEVVEAYPGEVESVNLSAETEVSYLITGSAGSVITIADPGVTLTVDGTAYTADETTGILTVDLSKLGQDPVVTLKNVSTVTANCLVTLNEGVGGAGNPEILEDPVEIPVSLPEEDSNGYHYQWTATTDGTVELKLKAEEAPEETEPVETTEETQLSEETEATEPETTEPEEEPVVLEVVATVGEETFRLSEFEDGVLSFAVEKNVPVLIQVIAMPWEDGYYPEIEETVLWNLLPDLGTLENPQVLEDIREISVSLEENDEDGWHYLWTATGDAQLTLTPPDGLTVTASVEEEVCQPAEGERALTFHVSRDQQILIQTIAVPVIPEGEETQSWPAVTGKITGQLLSDPGAPDNPVMLESIESVTVSLTEGDIDGYTCTWTAPLEGTLTLQRAAAETGAEVKVTTDDGTENILSDTPLSLEIQATDTVTFLVTAIPDEAGAYPAAEVTLTGSFEAAPGISAENPIVLSDLGSAMTVAMEARQTLYFSGMVHEMIATVEDANGVSIHYEGKTAWGSQTGVAAMEFPEANAEEPETPVLFSVTSKNEKELTLVFAYPAGHAQNPAVLSLGENQIQLKEADADGYLFNWTAECDGFLTVAMSETALWQYQITNLTSGTEGQLHTAIQEPVTAEETVEVKQGDLLQIMVKTLDPDDPEAVPAGKLTVTASFFDPLLGTDAKPIRLDNIQNQVNTLIVPAGQTLYYSAEAEGMLLSFSGSNVSLSCDDVEYTPVEGRLEIQCQSSKSVIVITNASEKDETCKLSFSYPEGHKKNPLELMLGENTAFLEDGNISGCAYVWTAEASGQLTITMEEETGWQFVLYNETSGTDGVVHTSRDEPKASSEVLEVTAGDRVLLIVNSFDPEHPLHPPAGEVRFTAEFVDPTLGMEENPVWLNLTDEIAIPAGKTMYCTAKADGMLLTLEGAGLKVVHNDVEHLPEQNTITFLCHGAGTFEHPVFAITNTGTADGVYSISFTYPEGHFMNPAELTIGSNAAAVDPDSKNGYQFLWTSDREGTLLFTMETADDWSYSVTNLTAGIVGETYMSSDEETVCTESIQVSAGDQIRIIVSAEEAKEIRFTVSVTPEEILQTNNEEPA